ncbi:UNVERIFIED_CONTAM: Inactive leucine-rich repeat receptor-like serine/threonine-protein kinase [Sesamum calycinum]|uniref:Inactive leucine-rich repeat receptor-like serine/threonine-protein kinase n=1 Tax=Sesamum calycinum TaxID=2727403 RepID=A0AAW2QY02_9LAMI
MLLHTDLSSHPSPLTMVSDLGVLVVRFAVLKLKAKSHLPFGSSTFSRFSRKWSVLSSSMGGGGTLLSRYNSSPSFLFFLLSSVFLLLSGLPQARSQDSEALLALKASIDPKGSLQWGGGSDFCQWQGVKECLNGRVTKLVVERFNLSGTLDGKSLNQLDQLRVLSFKETHSLGKFQSSLA